MVGLFVGVGEMKCFVIDLFGVFGVVVVKNGVVGDYVVFEFDCVW